MPHGYFMTETPKQHDLPASEAERSFCHRFQHDLKKLKGMITVGASPLGFPSGGTTPEIFLEMVVRPTEAIANDYMRESEDDYDNPSPAEYLLRLYMLDPHGQETFIQQEHESILASKETR